MFGRATIRLGIGPHSSSLSFPVMLTIRKLSSALQTVHIVSYRIVLSDDDAHSTVVLRRLSVDQRDSVSPDESGNEQTGELPRRSEDQGRHCRQHCRYKSVTSFTVCLTRLCFGLSVSDFNFHEISVAVFVVRIRTENTSARHVT